jgi:fumarylacetoacetate (FAA) hydrolase family protein
MILVVAVFLAGTGAIAGAIIGGVADLREFLGRKDHTAGKAQDRDKSE